MHLPASITSQQLLANLRRQHITTSMASPFMQRVSGLTATYCTPVTTAKLNASPRAIILHVPLNSLGMDRRRLMQRSRCHRFAIGSLGLLLCALGVGFLGGLLILFLGSLGSPTWHLVKGDDRHGLRMVQNECFCISCTKKTEHTHARLQQFTNGNIPASGQACCWLSCG